MPNAIDLTQYPFEPQNGDYLVRLGRMTPDKGAHRAMGLARRVGMPLKLAGKNSEPAEEADFDAHVRPSLNGRMSISARLGTTTRSNSFARTG
jgi:hypothetical protein